MTVKIGRPRPRRRQEREPANDRLHRIVAARAAGQVGRLPCVSPAIEAVVGFERRRLHPRAQLFVRTAAGVGGPSQRARRVCRWVPGAAGGRAHPSSLSDLRPHHEQAAPWDHHRPAAWPSQQAAARPTHCSATRATPWCHPPTRLVSGPLADATWPEGPCSRTAAHVWPSVVITGRLCASGIGPRAIEITVSRGSSQVEEVGEELAHLGESLWADVADRRCKAPRQRSRGCADTVPRRQPQARCPYPARGSPRTGTHGWSRSVVRRGPRSGAGRGPVARSRPRLGVRARFPPPRLAQIRELDITAAVHRATRPPNPRAPAIGSAARIRHDDRRAPARPGICITR
jgi:hypothetical protein